MKACSDTHSAFLGACFPYFLLEKAVCRPAGSLFLCECEIPNGLALSVTACAVPPLPKGEALAWRQSFRLNCKVYSFARGSPFGRAGALAPERASPLTAAPPLPSSPAAMPPSPRGRLQWWRQSFRHRQKASPWGSWLCAAKTEGVSSRSAALSQKAALQIPLPSTTPPVKRQFWKIRRFSRIAKFKIFFPLNMARAQRKPF